METNYTYMMPYFTSVSQLFYVLLDPFKMLFQEFGYFLACSLATFAPLLYIVVVVKVDIEGSCNTLHLSSTFCLLLVRKMPCIGLNIQYIPAVSKIYSSFFQCYLQLTL